MTTMELSSIELHILQNLIYNEIERCTHRLKVCTSKRYPLVDFYEERLKDLNKFYQKVL